MLRDLNLRRIALLLGVTLLVHRGLLGTGFVICQDQQGAKRLELGCAKSSLGCCQTLCDSEGAQARSVEYVLVGHPCSDTPLSDGAAEFVGRALTGGAELALLLAVNAEACGVNANRMLSARPQLWISRTCQAPRLSDALRHLRTVVLLV